MKNLAGVAECDTDIRRELSRSYIDAVDIEKGNTEVPYSVIGKVGDMTFKRDWCYWVVNCRVPLEIAKALYADPVGKTDIRVAGHCGCLPPEEWAFEEDGEEFVHHYHIDTEVGLRVFVDILRRHGFAPMEYRELFGDEVPEHLRAPLGQNPLRRAST